MSERNRELTRQTFEEIWNRGNLSIIDDHFASDYAGHSFAELAGREAVKRFVTMMRRAFPSVHYQIKDEIVSGDKVVQRWRIWAMHDGHFQGVAPTGKEVAIDGISIYRLAAGKLVEGWTQADLLGLMRQIGALPEAKQMWVAMNH
ncbi:MAG: ester cyclase [Candidatus Promineifilaceae bacterium]|nr:ester cyclase [Candidatus Promineifilaceae bacterium]